jgi:ferrous iron transport protein B
MKTNDNSIKVALVGNPSVGKSTLFSRLTGIGVIISNYPGTTVEVARGKVTHDSITLDISDLPGVYSIDTMSPEEKTLIDFLNNERPDVIINVIDSTRLERNLYLTLEILELDIPVVVCLNMMDEAESTGISIDVGALSKTLGTPVIPAVASKGIGLEELMHVFATPQSSKSHFHIRYDRHIESCIQRLKEIDRGITRYGAISLLASRDGEVPQGKHKHGFRMKGWRRGQRAHMHDMITTPEELAGRKNRHDGGDIKTVASLMRENIERTHNASISEIMASNRYGEAGIIARRVMKYGPGSGKRLMERIDSLLMNSVTGFVILAAIMTIMLLTVFYAGGFLEELIVESFDRYILIPVSTYLKPYPLIHTVITYTLIGVQAGFGIVFPYIMTFYVLMSILENSGYLTRAAFMLDDIMHRFRLHGRAMIPLILGFGCSVPAIMSTKALQTARERIITSALICMVPCSARSIIILGLVASFVSVWAAFSIYILLLLIIIAIGYILGRVVKGEETGFVLEMVPLRVPGIHDMINKTWIQVKEFIYVAFPLLIAGSALLGVLQYTGILDILNGLLSPLTNGLLGLPDYTATALIFGILRKEMALETLAVMAGTASFNTVLTGIQMYVFAIFTAIYMPCIATMAMLNRVLGWKDTALITILTLMLAVLISGAIAQIALAFLGLA